MITRAVAEDGRVTCAGVCALEQLSCAEHPRIQIERRTYQIGAAGHRS
jgi:hypothetical protein